MIQRTSTVVSVSSMAVEKQKVSACESVEKDYKAVIVYGSQIVKASWWNIR